MKTDFYIRVIEFMETQTEPLSYREVYEKMSSEGIIITEGTAKPQDAAHRLLTKGVNEGLIIKIYNPKYNGVKFIHKNHYDKAPGMQEWDNPLSDNNYTQPEILHQTILDKFEELNKSNTLSFLQESHFKVVTNLNAQILTLIEDGKKTQDNFDIVKSLINVIIKILKTSRTNSYSDEPRIHYEQNDCEFVDIQSIIGFYNHANKIITKLYPRTKINPSKNIYNRAELEFITVHPGPSGSKKTH